MVRVVFTEIHDPWTVRVLLLIQRVLGLKTKFRTYNSNGCVWQPPKETSRFELNKWRLFRPTLHDPTLRPSNESQSVWKRIFRWLRSSETGLMTCRSVGLTSDSRLPFHCGDKSGDWDVGSRLSRTGLWCSGGRTLRSLFGLERLVVRVLGGLDRWQVGPLEESQGQQNRCSVSTITVWSRC